jgi:rubrerythrin
MSNEQWVRVGIIGIEEAKRLQDKMHESGVELKLQFDEQTCQRGCAKTVEILAQEKDLAQLGEHMGKEYQKSLEGMDVNWDLMNEVFDPNKEQATCPACGFVFSTSESACPDCGLVFSA